MDSFQLQIGHEELLLFLSFFRQQGIDTTVDRCGHIRLEVDSMIPRALVRKLLRILFMEHPRVTMILLWDELLPCFFFFSFVDLYH